MTRLAGGTRLRAWDRRGTAVHEAGHLVVAQHLGLRGSRAWIEPSETGESLRMRYFVGGTAFPLASFNRLSLVRRAMVGVAGMVAGHAWDDRAQPEAWPPYWSDVLIFPECMSPSDWAKTGCLPGEWDACTIRACDRVADLLAPHEGPLWADLCSMARALIVESRGGSNGPRGSDGHFAQLRGHRAQKGSRHRGGLS